VTARGEPARGTILLVEDEEQVRQVVRRILEGSGYTVHAAAGVQDAERLMQGHAHSIDLLLSDVVLTESSGPALAEQLRRVRPDLKVLFMTGYSEPALAYAELVKAHVGMIHKPFTPRALIDRIRDVLS
jgi:two-component system cell cycle sensor histidine kinase/response regulator CckA